MLWLVRPLFDWEEAEHAVGAVAQLVGMGIDIYKALHGEGGEGDESEEQDQPAAEPVLAMQDEKGEQKTVTLTQMLGDHEQRLRDLEAAKPAPKARRKRAKK